MFLLGLGGVEWPVDPERCETSALVGLLWLVLELAMQPREA